MMSPLYTQEVALIASAENKKVNPYITEVDTIKEFDKSLSDSENNQKKEIKSLHASPINTYLRYKKNNEINCDPHELIQDPKSPVTFYLDKGKDKSLRDSFQSDKIQNSLINEN